MSWPCFSLCKPLVSWRLERLVGFVWYLRQVRPKVKRCGWEDQEENGVIEM